MFETSGRFNELIQSLPNVMPEQDGPINLCVRDANTFERSKSSGDTSGGSGCRGPSGMEWLGQFVDMKCTGMSTNDWTEGLRNALSQSDSGLVETDTESASRISPSPTSHRVVPVSASASTLYTSTPLRRYPDALTSRSQVKSEPTGERSVKQRASSMIRSNVTMRMSGRQAQLNAHCTRRRRVGWRGVAMCAACGMVCSGMDQLNLHFALAHSHLLALEWRMAQYNSTKTSKLLFQAQLDRLLSEKTSDNASSSCPASPLQTDVHSEIPNTTTSGTTYPLTGMDFEPDHEIKPSSSSDSKSTSSQGSPSPSHLSHANDETNQPPDLYASGSIETQRTPLSEVELCPLGPKPTASPDLLNEDDRRGNSRSKGYPCPRCSYTAKWPTELQKHVMVHANSRPFVCCVCSTSYKWSWDLGRHFSNAHPGLLNPYKRLRVTRHGSNAVRNNTTDTIPIASTHV
ncbi:unnamed protein product [Echinostoma caproni]|uniref:C2H2-type domain-containing protein n=1 Tax=Echinostoma caproni TaxID=27848 RepID=A0A183A5E7_9TREM|nr:unnamed protein product [Echinostoma caproni]